MSELDEIVRHSLSTFAVEGLGGSWDGYREREAVSYFAFGFLLREVKDDGLLYDPAQIGIEVPVPQISQAKATKLSKREGAKSQVCKDIVIWPRAGMTCWDDSSRPTIAPSAVLEWKFGTPTLSETDIAWLQSFSDIHEDCIGFAITANRPGTAPRLQCARISHGLVNREWLIIN